MAVHITPKAALAALAVSTLVFTGGCATTGSQTQDTAYVARDVNTLYLVAKQRLDQGQARPAAALFDEVERQHPYSP